jgi:hypothetical protein
MSLDTGQISVKLAPLDGHQLDQGTNEIMLVAAALCPNYNTNMRTAVNVTLGCQVKTFSAASSL